MRACLPRLTEMGIVEHIGRNKYILARSLYAAGGKAGVYTRRSGLDRDTNKELLLKHIRKSGMDGTPFKELQLNCNQVSIMLQFDREVLICWRE